MARRVFFSFHYGNDIFRANVVRNSWVVKKDQGGVAGWNDASLWEKAKTSGDAAIKTLIDQGLTGASVTAVLIGEETWERRYVKYEILESWRRKKGLIGIYLGNIRDLHGHSSPRGKNPFGEFTVTYPDRRQVPMDQLIPTYDWVNNDGYANLESWVEAAALAAESR